MQFYNRGFATLAILTVLSVPIAVSAQVDASASSSDDVQAKIRSLFSEIQTLRQELSQWQGSSTLMQAPGNGMGMFGSTAVPMMPGSMSGASSTVDRAGTRMCHDFERSLKIGSTGNDVIALQQVLAQNSSVYPEGTVSGYFGPATARAVARFQMQNGASSTGTVGPMTRGFLNDRCSMRPMTNMQNGSSTAPWMNDDHRMPMMPAGTSSTSTYSGMRYETSSGMMHLPAGNWNASGTPPLHMHMPGGLMSSSSLQTNGEVMPPPQQNQ